MANQKATLSWQAPEFKYYKKNTAWYVTFVAVVTLILAYFVFTKDYFAVTTTVILGIIVLLFARQKPEQVTIELDRKGINFSNLSYPYKQIKFFWIVNNENHRTLNMETMTYFNHHLILELEQQDPDTVREFLLNFLPEHEQTQETWSQRLMHRFRF